MLAIATLDRPNLLILDEPTNHLDIDAREELLEALNEYEGAVILISHDRRLVEACADRLWLVADGRVRGFDGDLEDYKRFVLSAQTSTTTETPRETRSSSRADQRREAAAVRERLKPLKAAMDQAERDVAKLHARIAEIDAALAAPGLFARDPAKGEKLSRERAEAVRALSDAEHRWVENAEAYEAAMVG
jgi:ATP-binding cassette subfamily F protein 3